MNLQISSQINTISNNIKKLYEMVNEIKRGSQKDGSVHFDGVLTESFKIIKDETGMNTRIPKGTTNIIVANDTMRHFFYILPNPSNGRIVNILNEQIDSDSQGSQYRYSVYVFDNNLKYNVIPNQISSETNTGIGSRYIYAKNEWNCTCYNSLYGISEWIGAKSGVEQNIFEVQYTNGYYVLEFDMTAYSETLPFTTVVVKITKSQETNIEQMNLVVIPTGIINKNIYIMVVNSSNELININIKHRDYLNEIRNVKSYTNMAPDDLFVHAYKSQSGLWTFAKEPEYTNFDSDK